MMRKDLNIGFSDQVRGSSLCGDLPIVLRRSGDLSEEPEPDPISNSAVKLLSADGTVSQDPGE
jgi:hypothetical protein